jgi:N-methylhydantoinase A
VLIPRAAGVLSAFGGQQSDIVRELTAPFVTDSRSFDFEGVRHTLDGLRERMRAFEQHLPETLTGDVRSAWFVEARYAHQVWDISIPLAGDGVEDERALELLVASFHDAHERIFAVREPEQRVEMSQWKGRLTVGTAKPPLDARRGNGAAPGARPPRRTAFFADLGAIEIPTHLGAELAPGAHVDGPALVIEPETTIVVYPGWTAQVTALGNYRLELG